MFVVINSYQSGRPSKVAVATVIRYLQSSLTADLECELLDLTIQAVCHVVMTSERRE